MPYTHLTLDERYVISHLTCAGFRTGSLGSDQAICLIFQENDSKNCQFWPLKPYFWARNCGFKVSLNPQSDIRVSLNHYFAPQKLPFNTQFLLQSLLLLYQYQLVDVVRPQLHTHTPTPHQLHITLLPNCGHAGPSLM